MCGCSSNCCKDSCSLDHECPGIFDKSQWCGPNRVSTWYWIYRVFVALIMISGIAAQMTNSKLGVKWFIYMTDQGIFFLATHFLLDACLVTARWTWERMHPEEQHYHQTYSLNPLYKISWALNSCFFSIALWISIIYWSILHKYVVEAHLLQNEAAVYLNIFLHAFNSIICFIDIFISGRPWKIFHFMYPILFGFYYAGFSLIYWGAGGVGVCYPTKEGHPTATVQVNNNWCDPFIYPILDWQSHPLIAIGVILGGCIAMPLIHFFWMSLAWFRQLIHSKTNNSGDEQESLPFTGRRRDTTTTF